MYADFQQYLLTASFLLPTVLVSYVAIVLVSKLLTKLSGASFSLPYIGHFACIVVAGALAPFVALFFFDRPAELMEGGKKLIWVGAIAALLVHGFSEGYGRKEKAGTDEKVG